eukprot:11134757-Prorocentrum_lima.AAC.1
MTSSLVGSEMCIRDRWLHRVLTGWRLPPWAHNGLQELVIGRTVRACIGGKMLPRRHLRCGIGMGSPASLLTWAMIFDPLVQAMRESSGAATPVYVDDVAMLTRGARQT